MRKNTLCVQRSRHKYVALAFLVMLLLAGITGDCRFWRNYTLIDFYSEFPFYKIWNFRGDMIWWSLLALPAASEYLKNTTFRELVPETYFLNILTRLVAPEDFINSLFSLPFFFKKPKYAYEIKAHVMYVCPFSTLNKATAFHDTSCER